MCLNTGTLKKFNFSFETNGTLMALGVPILKHFRVPTEILNIGFEILATVLNQIRLHC